nr:MAG TPA: hypothetical protein [Caudoviricetes sp.]
MVIINILSIISIFQIRIVQEITAKDKLLKNHLISHLQAKVQAVLQKESGLLLTEITF